MKELDRSEWTHRAYRYGTGSVLDCLTSCERMAEAIIVHQAERVFVRISYRRDGEVHEHFLEIPDMERSPA